MTKPYRPSNPKPNLGVCHLSLIKSVTSNGTRESVFHRHSFSFSIVIRQCFQDESSAEISYLNIFLIAGFIRYVLGCLDCYLLRLD